MVCVVSERIISLVRVWGDFGDVACQTIRRDDGFRKLRRWLSAVAAAVVREIVLRVADEIFR